MNHGREALARVLEQVAQAAERVKAGEDPQAIADAIWVDFVSAVAGAQAELRRIEAEGVRRWQEARRAH